MSDLIEDGTYRDNLCPDCFEKIPTTACEGEACENCGHVFWNATNATPPDFEIRDAGSVVQFRPLNQVAKQFVETELELEGYQWLGSWFCIDARVAYELKSSLENEGFLFKA